MSVSPLVTGDAVAVQGLRRRAREVCVVYRDHPMPAGVEPAAARLGVEVDPATDRTTLYVQRGLHYTGDDPQVQRWVADGELVFDRFVDTERWLAAHLGLRAAGPEHDSVGPAVPRARDAAVAATLAMGGSDDRRTPTATALTTALGAVVRGQDHVLPRLAGHIARHLRRTAPQRPATALLLGPTGVGKTRTAQRLAEALTEHARVAGGHAYGYLRLDMNEYRERYRVSCLLGAPPGYVGYRDGAPLIDALRADPRQVVLFDEIDKAHSDVLTVLLNLIDRGRLDSPTGGSVDARHAVLLFTSNQGGAAVADRLAGPPPSESELDELCRTELLRAGLAPELLGRIRTLLPFGRLDDRSRAEIAFDAVRHAGAEYGLQVAAVEPAVLRRILDICGGASLGARPIEHAVDPLVGNALLAAAEAGCDSPVGCGLDGATVVVRPLPADSGSWPTEVS